MAVQDQALLQKNGNLIKVRSSNPDFLKELIETEVTKRLQVIDTGIKKTQEKLQIFEQKYKLTTIQFVDSFTSDRLQHSLDFDEWLGEAWMLEKLKEKRKILEEIEFVN